MNCLKCGRETVAEQIFCEDCLLEMEKYPVKPGTAVKLPERREPSTFRRMVKRRAVPLEEQVRILKTRVFRLTIVMVLLFIIIGLMIPPTVTYLFEEHYEKGQNYSVVTTTVPTETTATAPSNPSP